MRDQNRIDGCQGYKWGERMNEKQKQKENYFVFFLLD